MTASAPDRLGDVRKCPVCGSPADPDAYYCAQCHNYYCFRCRAQMQGSEPRYQCLNQACDFHGKQVCGSCDPEVRVDEPPTRRTERETGWWPLLLLMSLAVLGLSWASGARLPLAAALALAAFAAAALVLHRRGTNVFGRIRAFEVPHYSMHHACVRCGQPARAAR